MNKAGLVIGLFFFGLGTLLGQQPENAPSQDAVYLKDGSLLRGELLEYQPEGTHVLRAQNGVLLEIPAQQVEKIIQESLSSMDAGNYRFQEKGWYHHSLAGIMDGESVEGDFSPGLLLEHISGYQWNRWLGAGLGIGYSNFQLDEEWTLVPVFVELRGYLLPRNVSPYYRIAGGYAWGITPSGENIEDLEGGLFFHPALGVRVGGGSTAFTFDLGYRFQEALLKYEPFQWGETRIETQYTFKRLTLRVGMLF